MHLPLTTAMRLLLVGKLTRRQVNEVVVLEMQVSRKMRIDIIGNNKPRPMALFSFRLS
jgi:hypothetical protein